MKQTAIAALMVVFLAAQATAEEGTVLKEKIEKDSYATGVALVRNLKQQGGAFDLDLVIKGMKDELTGEKLLLTEEGLQTTLTALQNEVKKNQQRGAIASTDSYSAISRDDVPLTPASSPQAPAPARKPVRDEEEGLAALAVATLAPSTGSAQLTPASLASSQAPEAPVPDHSFAALAVQQQQQFNNDGTVQIVLSSLTRKYAETWLKTLPRQQ